MPFSHSAQISAIVGFAEAMQPSSVLDVGVGMGQYGVLLRNNLEHANLFEVTGASARQRPREQWRVRIDGIEGYGGYLTPVHAWAYQQVQVGDALDLLARLDDASYDLVIAIDILEHFFPDDGLRLLAQCKRVARHTALVSTPKAFVAQHVEANPLEDHRSVWTADQLAAAGFTSVLPDATSWIAWAKGQGASPSR
jgi:SAM-dependent methyltransferase